MNSDRKSQLSTGENKVDSDHAFHTEKDFPRLFLWILDLSGNILALNIEVINRLGYTPDYLVGKSFFKLGIVPESKKEEIFPDEFPSGIILKSESSLTCKDGTALAVYLMSERIALRSDSCILISALATVSAQSAVVAGKDARQDLKEIQSCRDNIFSVIAHDLRSPFNTILGYCELLNSSIMNSELNKSLLYTRIIRDATEQTLSFLVRLLDWGRLQNEQPIFNPGVFEAELPIKQIVRLCGFQAETKNVALKTNIDRDLKVYGDLNMIRTVLVNLITNAIKYCNSGGKILIRAHPVSDGVEFSIADNGIGINKEDIRKLFGPQKPYSTNGTGMEQGTGLGLAICKSYIDLHHGRIWAESEPGKGSRFKFILPVKNLP